MARPSPRSKSSKRGQHGDAIGHLPGDPNLVLRGEGPNPSGQGPRKIKGPGTDAKITGKTPGMGGGKGK